MFGGSSSSKASTAARRGRGGGFIPDFEIAGIKESEAQQQQQQKAAGRGGARREPDVSSAIQAALRNGVLHIANRGVSQLPWTQMFPDEDPDAGEDDGITAKIGAAPPASSATPIRTGRKIVPLHQKKNTAVDLSGSNSSQQIKFWEGAPIQQIDASSNSISTLASELNRWVRLGETIKIMLLGSNKISSLPFSFAPFSQLAQLNLSRNELEGDLCQLLVQGTACNDTQQQQQQQQQIQPPVLPSLQELVCSFNKGITSAVGILELVAPNLRVLRVNNCSLQNFSLLLDNPAQQQQPFVSSLREIDLSHNALSACPGLFSTAHAPHTEPVAHPCLEIIECSFNKFNGHELLIGQQQQQHQQQQQIHPAWRQHLTSLRSLTLRGCGLSAAAVSTLPLLAELNLSENAMQTFPSICIASRQKLACIDLTANKLASLAPLCSASNATTFVALERLLLDNNELKTVEPELCLIGSLRQVSLVGNPLRAIRRELLQNAGALKAYLRTRLPESQNDDVTNNRAVRLQNAMDAKQQELLQQEPAAADVAADVSSAVPQQQQQQQQQQQHRSVQLPTRNGGGGGVMLIGKVSGRTWDLSRSVSHSRGGGGGVVTRRGLTLATAGAVGEADNDGTPLLPELLQASTISEVATCTTHVRGCSAINLAGQSRLRSIAVDFFENIVPNVEDLDLSRTGVCNLESVLGDPKGPLSLKALKASHCALSGPWPREWCRPLPGPEQKIVSIDLSNNALSGLCAEFGLSVAWSLRHLNLNGNRLGVIPEALMHLRFLNELLLSSNGISQLPEEPPLYECWPDLTMLDLSANRLGDSPPQPIARALGGFSPEKMRSLQLGMNGIRWATKLVDGPTPALLSALHDRM